MEYKLDKKQIRLVLYILICILSLSANTADAAPKNGLGVSLGYASHNVSGKLDFGGSANYTSSGMSYGIDYLFLVAPDISLSPFLMLSSETGGGDLKDGTSVGHGILGMQGRYWMGPSSDFFIGAHIGSYSEALSNGDTTSASGTGFGISAGWESSDIPLFVMGQYDTAQVKYSDMKGDITGFRLSIGFRWK